LFLLLSPQALAHDKYAPRPYFHSQSSFFLSLTEISRHDSDVICPFMALTQLWHQHRVGPDNVGMRSQHIAVIIALICALV